MEFNLTVQHFFAFAFMAYLASFFAKGTRLVRLVGWIALWQLLTPVRPIWQDVPMMLVGWALSEYLYHHAVKWLGRGSV